MCIHLHKHMCTAPTLHTQATLSKEQGYRERLPLTTYLIVMSGGQEIILGLQMSVSIGSTLRLVEREGKWALVSSVFIIN